jgi:hypothetical protein
MSKFFLLSMRFWELRVFLFCFAGKRRGGFFDTLFFFLFEFAGLFNNLCRIFPFYCCLFLF